MKKVINANELYKLQDALQELYDENIKFSIDTALPLLELKKDVDEKAEIFTNKVVEIIPGILIGAELTEEEQNMYNGLLATPIEIDTNALSLIRLSLKDTDTLSLQTFNVLLTLL